MATVRLLFVQLIAARGSSHTRPEAARECYQFVIKIDLTQLGLGGKFGVRKGDRGCEMCEDFPCCGHDHGDCPNG